MRGGALFFSSLFFHAALYFSSVGRATRSARLGGCPFSQTIALGYPHTLLFQNAQGYPHTLLLFNMPKGILTHLCFQNAQEYPHTVCSSKCPRVSSHSLLFKMPKGIVTQFVFESAQGYPQTLLSSNCPRVSSHTLAFQKAQGYPHTLLFPKCPRLSSHSLLFILFDTGIISFLLPDTGSASPIFLVCQFLVLSVYVFFVLLDAGSASPIPWISKWTCVYKINLVIRLNRSAFKPISVIL